MKNIPILILHGWNLSAGKFLPLKTEFEKMGYKVFCPDLPGFGYNEIPLKPLYLSDYLDFVVKYINKIKSDKFILVGHSFGGRIGIRFAIQHPENLHALILTGAPGINPVSSIKVLFFLILAKLGRQIFSLPILSYIRSLSRKLLYKLANASDYYNTNEFMLETFKNTINESLIPYLRQIDIPTLLIWGRDDKIVPLVVAEKMNKMITNSKLVVINNARHGASWTHPKEFVKEVKKFLKEQN